MANLSTAAFHVSRNGMIAAFILLLSAAAPARGAPSPGTPVDATLLTTHGLHIVMQIPEVRPLPGPLSRSALLPVRVQVTNETVHPVMLPRPCDRSNPRAVVGNGNGTIVYSTIRTFPVYRRCIARAPVVLAPGHTVQRYDYVILRGPVVQPVVDVFAHGHDLRLTGAAYTLPLLPTYLTPRATAYLRGGQHVQLTAGRGDVPLYAHREISAIEVQARKPAAGPLVIIGSALCPGRSILVPTWTIVSTSRTAARIPAPCPRPTLWVFLYGWPGQSVGDVTVGVGNLRPTT